MFVDALRREERDPDNVFFYYDIMNERENTWGRNEKRENNVLIKRTKASEISWLLMENPILPGEHRRRSSREEPVISRQVRREGEECHPRDDRETKKGELLSRGLGRTIPEDGNPGEGPFPWWEVPPYHSNPRIVFLEFRQRDDNKYISRYD